MFTSQDIRGVWATVLLDVRTDGQVRMESIGHQIAAYAAAGVNGVYCNGTAGEFHAMTNDVFEEVSKRTVDAARANDLPVQVSAAHLMAPGAIARIKLAAALAPDAIQVTLPDWTPINIDTALRFLDGCADAAAGVPLVLYNPPHAKAVLSPEEIAVVAEKIPQVIGAKCGGGDAAWYDEMRPLLDRLSVFIPGHQFSSGVAAGAHGSYSNMACLSPHAAVRWARETATDPNAAANTENRIARFMDEAIAPLLRAGQPGFACDKAMAEAGGLLPPSQRFLWPQSPIPEGAVARIRQAAHRHIPEFLSMTEPLA